MLYPNISKNVTQLRLHVSVGYEMSEKSLVIIVGF